MSSSLLSSVVVCSLTAFLFIDSWHRHGHYTVAYGFLFTFALLVMLTERLISKRRKWRQVARSSAPKKHPEP
jgi:bacteriorhodopsin